MRILLASVLVLAIVTTTDAARWYVRALSVQGATIELTGRLRSPAPGRLVGRLRCHRPPVGRCLGKRGAFQAYLDADGTFTATLLFRATGVSCLAGGTGTTVGLNGQYTCRSGAVTLDYGVFIGERRS